MSNVETGNELQHLRTLSELPDPFRQILIENSRLSRKILVMQTEMQQKDQIIQQLKQQLDLAVVQHTQQKLAYSRTVQNQIERRVKEVKQQYLERNLDFDQRLLALNSTIEQLQSRLKLQGDKNLMMGERMASLKLYIQDIIEKDFLIGELGEIIGQQQAKLSGCRCGCIVSGEEARKRKSAVIRRNE